MRYSYVRQEAEAGVRVGKKHERQRYVGIISFFNLCHVVNRDRFWIHVVNRKHVVNRDGLWMHVVNRDGLWIHVVNRDGLV